MPDYDSRWSEGRDTREDENNLLKDRLRFRTWHEIWWLNTGHPYGLTWASYSSDGHASPDEFPTVQSAWDEIMRLEMLDDARNPVRRVVVVQTRSGNTVPDPRVSLSTTARITVDPVTGLLTSESTCTIAGETVSVPFRRNNGIGMGAFRVAVAIRRLGYCSPRYLDTIVLTTEGYFEVEVEKI